MDEDRFNLALRGFLKEAGITSQREIEKLVREHPPQAGILRLRMALTSPDAPTLNHVIEHAISPTWIEHGIGESNPTLFEFAPVTAAGLAPRSPQRDRSFGPRQADTAIQVVPALNAGRRHN